MQTNSDSEITSGHAFVEEEDKIDLEPKPEALIEDAGADDPTEAEPTVHPSELVPPKVRAPSKHIVNDAKYGDLDGVGIIYGNVGSTEFHFRVDGDIEKMEYIQVKHATTDGCWARSSTCRGRRT